jgi:hypothetical protein
MPNLLVGLGRVELPTSPLSGVRSSHLSYRPNRCSQADPRRILAVQDSSCQRIIQYKQEDAGGASPIGNLKSRARTLWPFSWVYDKKVMSGARHLNK